MDMCVSFHSKRDQRDVIATSSSDSLHRYRKPVY